MLSERLKFYEYPIVILEIYLHVKLICNQSPGCDLMNVLRWDRHDHAIINKCIVLVNVCLKCGILI